MSNPVFDEKDGMILEATIDKRNKLNGPLVGDYVILMNGEIRRFTQHCADEIQLTNPRISDARFYLDHFSGTADYSGALDSPISKNNLVKSDEKWDASFWFFHHGYVTAHNGVNFKIKVSVYYQIA